MTDSQKGEIGVLGLAVMGANLARNFHRNGYVTAVYNRSGDVTSKFIESFGDSRFVASETLQDFIKSLDKPRRIILMIKAGAPVDAVLSDLFPLLDSGDVVMDGGNSLFHDTERRAIEASKRGIHFLGVGISGGEEGALNGPSIMPGGSVEGYKSVSSIFQRIAAVIDGPCVTHVGPGGSGHFVKMVHNGIEYGDMQLIAEIYSILRDSLGKNPEEIGALFENWNQGKLQSYLIEITSKIFKKRDNGSNNFLLDSILDVAEQKGTGRWTVQEALSLGVPVPTLAAAVDMRTLSSMQSLRKSTNLNYSSVSNETENNLLEHLEKALYVSKIISYAQGFSLIQAASKNYGWKINCSELARIWKGGCIIRAKFLDLIQSAFAKDNDLENLIISPLVMPEIKEAIQSLRLVVSRGALSGLSLLTLQSSLSYFEALRVGRLPLNLTQAQRDFFGAHTFQRIDKEGFFHAEW